MRFWVEIIFVFFADMLLDVCCARYTIAANNFLPGKAAAWSVAIAINAGLSTIVFVDNYYTIISGACGAAIGTYWAVWHAKKEKAAQ